MSQQSRTSNLEWIDKTRQCIAFLIRGKSLIKGIVRDDVTKAIPNETLERFYISKDSRGRKFMSEISIQQKANDE